jgi:hypothetical protein
MTPEKKLTSNAKNKQLLPRARRRKFTYLAFIYCCVLTIAVTQTFQKKMEVNKGFTGFELIWETNLRRLRDLYHAQCTLKIKHLEEAFSRTHV